MIRLLIADDHEVVRHGLRRIVDDHPDIQIVGEAETGDALLEELESTTADVLVLDISMPGPGFIEIMETVRSKHPEMPVLVLSVHGEAEWAVRAYRSGAAAFLSKERSSPELAQAIRRIHGGGRYVTPTVAERLAELMGPEGSLNPHDALSDREFQVLRMLGAGRSIKRIAADLGLSHRTISTYRSRVLEKLDLDTTADLIRYVVQHDLDA